MKKKEKLKSVFGYHLILDCYGCDAKALDSIEVCYKYLDGMVDLIGVHRQAPPLVVYTDPIK